MSRTNGAVPVLWRARTTAAFSVNGTNVVVLEGSVYLDGNPIVKGASWLFERDVVSAERPEIQALARNRGGNGSVAVDAALIADELAAAERLREVRVELASLRRPLPRSNGSVDVNGLATTLAERSARRQALEAALPDFERQALVARLATCEAGLQIEKVAHAEAAEVLRTVEAARRHAEADVATAQAVVGQLFSREMNSQWQTEAALAAIAQLDVASGVVDEPYGDTADANGSSSLDDGEIVVDMRPRMRA